MVAFAPLLQNFRKVVGSQMIFCQSVSVVWVVSTIVGDRDTRTLTAISGGSKGARGTPPGAQILSISCSFVKIWQNRMLVPPSPTGELTPTPLENPGSATGYNQFYLNVLHSVVVGALKHYSRTLLHPTTLGLSHPNELPSEIFTTQYFSSL